MRNIFILISLIIFSSCSNKNKSIIDNTIQRINAIETIEFSTSLKMKNYFQNDSIEYNIFLDFTSDDTLIGTKYMLSLEKGSKIATIYNGESIYDFVGDTIYFEDNPNHVLNGFVLENPILKTKYLLKEARNDSTVVVLQKNDTIINNMQLHKIELNVKGKYLIDGKLQKQDNDDLIIHEIYLRKEDYLPVKTRTIFKKDEAIFTSIIKSINENYDSSSLLWELDDFSNKYTKINVNLEGAFDKLINKGVKAKSWTLPNLEGENVNYNTESNKLTLLEFWFTGCGFCSMAHPYLNDFFYKYKNKGLEIFSIEFEEIDLLKLKKYINHEKINYPVLYSGKDVAKMYGVSGAPTFILIDEKGYVVYSSFGFKSEYMDELEKEIKKHIQK